MDVNVKEAIEYLLGKFKIERYLYLTSTVLSTIGLMILIGINVHKGADFKYIITLFGPSGVIVYSGSRILKMWNDCIKLVTKSLGYEENQQK